MRRYTTNEAAAKLGVHRITLQRWIAAKLIPAPKVQNIGGGLFRLWTAKDIERARKAMGRERGKP
jgi:excisionase family DNA binding protein